MTREQMVQASILLRGGELYDLGLLLQDDQSPADLQRWACRDPLQWAMRVSELSRLVHLGRCLPLLAIVAKALPPEVEWALTAGRPPPQAGGAWPGSWTAGQPADQGSLPFA